MRYDYVVLLVILKVQLCVFSYEKHYLIAMTAHRHMNTLTTLRSGRKLPAPFHLSTLFTINFVKLLSAERETAYLYKVVIFSFLH
jgi:hypothetical protein